MKVAYVKVKDPILWTKAEDLMYDDDLDNLNPIVIRKAGIILREDEEQLIIGEIHTEEDNKKLNDWGVQFPRYRYLAIINKLDIIERKDFEVTNRGSESKKGWGTNPKSCGGEG